MQCGPCENFLYGFKAAPRGRSRRRLGRLSQAPAPLPPGWPLTPVGWRERQRRGRGNPGKSRNRGGFDTGTPRGGSIGLMRSTWEGRPIAGKRTAAPPCQIRHSACTEPPLYRAPCLRESAATVKKRLTVALAF